MGIRLLRRGNLGRERPHVRDHASHLGGPRLRPDWATRYSAGSGAVLTFVGRWDRRLCDMPETALSSHSHRRQPGGVLLAQIGSYVGLSPLFYPLGCSQALPLIAPASCSVRSLTRLQFQEGGQISRWSPLAGVAFPSWDDLGLGHRMRLPHWFGVTQVVYVNRDPQIFSLATT